jgi:glycosyltransferase involved in cell wall biosynthesis
MSDWDSPSGERDVPPRRHDDGTGLALTDGASVAEASNGRQPADETGANRWGGVTDVEMPDASDGCIVAIPAYNEAGTIADVVSRAEPHADEVLVVDDGSDDDTAVRARGTGATVVEHRQNEGYGATLKRTFREAKRRGAATLVVVDGDGQHDPADIPRLLDRQTDDHPKLVIGSRFVGDRTSDIPAYRRFGLWLVNAITNLSMGTVRSRNRVSDTQSGFRAYNAAAIDSLTEDGGIGAGMGASTDVLHHARRRGFDIEEVGIEISYDVANASNHNSVGHGLALVSNLLRTVERDHPIALLGVPGFSSTLVGFVFGYWMLTNYVTSGTFPVGIAIAAVFFVLVGVFACFTGIILHSLNQYFDADASVRPRPARALAVPSDRNTDIQSTRSHDRDRTESRRNGPR